MFPSGSDDKPAVDFELTQDLVERMPLILFILDPKGKILYVNEAARNLVGFKPEGLMDQNWWGALFNPEQRGQVELLRDLVKEKDVTGYELTLPAKEGRAITLEICTENRYDQPGNLMYTAVFGIDVTGRKWIEEKLKRKERELDQVQQIAHLGSWIWDIPSDVVTWSDEMYRIYGLTPQEGGLSYEDFLARVHPDDKEKVHNIVQAAYQDFKPFEFEHRIIRPDGQVWTLSARGEVILGEEGKPVRMVGTGQDITERRTSEETLRSRDDMLRSVVAGAPAILFMVDDEGVIQLSVGKSLAALQGLSASVGQSIYEACADIPHFIERFEQSLSGKSFNTITEEEDKIFETRYEPFLAGDGRISGVIGVVTDITDRVRAERALRENEERFRLLLESVKEYAIFTLDPQGYVTSWNAGAESIQGYSAEEIIGQHYSAFFRREDIEEGKPQSNLDIAQRNGRCEDEGWRVRKDGSKFWANAVIAALRDEKGELRGFSKVVRDMTQRKQAEEKIRQSEARFRTIFYGAAVGIELVDLEGHLLEFNPAIGKIFGYSHKELRESLASDIHHPANVVVNSSVFEEFRAGKRIFYYAEKPFMDKDGHLIWGRLTVNLVNDADGEPQFLIGMIEDISEQKQMESELVELKRRLMEGMESERLHLAQELHDGPIQDLYGLTYDLSALRQTIPEGADCDLTEKMSASAQKVINTLRAISGELRPPVLAPFGLQRAIQSHIEEFQKSKSDLKVNLELMPDDDLLPERVRLALYRIYQTSFTNVVRHAEASQATVRLKLSGERVTLEIEDDGKGFAVPNRWITLARGGHLGIIGAAERAEALRGSLEVHSSPGRGTRIRATIPLKDEEDNEPFN
ncbi:MAG TPA: PAS domain S-box protein [Anaerolineales bacterium]|nr:PAS domain S-box protein [Anaerolineales bacterium]